MHALTRMQAGQEVLAEAPRTADSVELLRKVPLTTATKKRRLAATAANDDGDGLTRLPGNTPWINLKTQQSYL